MDRRHTAATFGRSIEFTGYITWEYKILSDNHDYVRRMEETATSIESGLTIKMEGEIIS